MARLCHSPWVRRAATLSLTVEHLPQGGRQGWPDSSFVYVSCPQLVSVSVWDPVPPGPLVGAELQAASSWPHLATKAGITTLGVREPDPQVAPKFGHEYHGARISAVGRCVLYPLRTHTKVQVRSVRGQRPLLHMLPRQGPAPGCTACLSMGHAGDPLAWLQLGQDHPGFCHHGAPAGWYLPLAGPTVGPP